MSFTKKNENNKNSREPLSFLAYFTKSNKYPLLITLAFFLVISYITFFHHHYWINPDGILYLRAGEQIIHGGGYNVKLGNAPIGGPVFYAALNLLLNNGFLTLKIISLLNGTAIVFLSYYIIKNVFDSKIAFVGQLFFAFSPALISRTVLSTNELLPIVLILISLFFVTKKQVNLTHIMIVGTMLGLAAMVRSQAIPVFFAILVFLLIRDKKIRSNLFYGFLLCIFFVIGISPLITYNHFIHETLLDSDTSLYMLDNFRYQTPEWRDKVITAEGTPSLIPIFYDFNLSLKNYFYDLFYHNPNLLFNFNFHNAISIIPIIPYVGIIPVLGGLVYCLRINRIKNNLIIFFGTFTVTTLLVFFLGDFNIHYFAIIIVPFVAIGLYNIRNIEGNLLSLLILSVIFVLIISIVPMDRAEQLIAMWISITVLSSVFFMEVIPKLIQKMKKLVLRKNDVSTTTAIKMITIILLSLALLANFGYSYKDLKIILYGDSYTYDIKNELLKLFQKNDRQELGIEYKQIGDILSKQPGIESSYVMAKNNAYSYYAHSKSVYSTFQEGVAGNTLDNFLTRKNWSPHDLYFSNLNSWPIDRPNVYKPIPDYIVYQAPKSTEVSPLRSNNTQTRDLMILSDPNNPNIPHNFELIYKSNKTDTIVYKINHKLTDS